jgi:hypothetical protein
MIGYRLLNQCRIPEGFIFMFGSIFLPTAGAHPNSYGYQYLALLYHNSIFGYYVQNLMYSNKDNDHHH